MTNKILLLQAIKDDMHLNDNNFPLEIYYYRITEKTGPINYSTEDSIQLNKDHVPMILDSQKGKKELYDNIINYN